MKKDTKLSFNQDKNLIALEDWFYWIELLTPLKKLCVLEDKLIKYRVRDNSISVRTTVKSYIKAYYLYKLSLKMKRINLIEYFTLNLINTFKLLRRKFAFH